MVKFSWMAAGLVVVTTGAFAQDYSAVKVVERAVVAKMMSGPGLSGRA